jgi:hypothetical protein
MRLVYLSIVTLLGMCAVFGCAENASATKNGELQQPISSADVISRARQYLRGTDPEAADWFALAKLYSQAPWPNRSDESPERIQARKLLSGHTFWRVLFSSEPVHDQMILGGTWVYVDAQNGDVLLFESMK